MKHRKGRKVILVTGISSGFGLEFARGLAQDGHVVYGTARRNVKDRLAGVNYIEGVDVRSEADVARAVDIVVSGHGRVDVLICNAGMGVGGPAEFTAMDDVSTQMDTNFLGLVHCVRHVLPVMRRQEGGMIVAMSSIGGRLGLPFQSFYSASKFAVEGFCEALRIETRRAGVKVVVIEPGDFSTSFTSKRIKPVGTDVAQAYPEYAESMKGIERDEEKGLKPGVLADKVRRIVMMKHPHQRYIVASPLQKASVFLKGILPPCLFSRLLGLFYGV